MSQSKRKIRFVRLFRRESGRGRCTLIKTWPRNSHRVPFPDKTDKNIQHAKGQFQT